MAYKIFFHRSARGERQVRTFLRGLPSKHRAKCIDYLRRVQQVGTRLPSNIVKHLEAGLWEARPEYGGVEYRLFFFVHANNMVGVVSAIVKKRQKVERRVIEHALALANEMRQEWERKT